MALSSTMRISRSKGSFSSSIFENTRGAPGALAWPPPAPAAARMGAASRGSISGQPLSSVLVTVRNLSCMKTEVTFPTAKRFFASSSCSAVSALGKDLGKPTATDSFSTNFTALGLGVYSISAIFGIKDS